MNARIHILLIDLQNDFIDTPVELLPVGQRPALAVPGSYMDTLRAACLIDAIAPKVERIFATMDSHPFVAIERTTFWRDAQGNEVGPFTEVAADDVRAERFVPAQAELIDPVSGKSIKARVIELLEKLEASGRKLMVWPVHCVKGSWGAALHPSIMDSLNNWERQSTYSVAKVDKGEYPLVEHFGVFEAQTPLDEVESTRFNTNLAEKLNGHITVLAGQAGSHCVADSYDQLVRRRQSGKGIIVVTDCMSPVGGFEQAQADFFARAKANGSLLMKAEEVVQLVNDIR